MQSFNRRDFFRQAAVVGGTAFGLEGLMMASANTALGQSSPKGKVGYGPLFPLKATNGDAIGITSEVVSLPEGFQYKIIGRRGQIMTDGTPTPGAHDGMDCYLDRDGNLRLIRNHEQGGGAAFTDTPFDPNAAGGTTTVVVDPVTREIIADYPSLSGTIRNCAGGSTPWGSWITCEETGDAGHGYNFEVPLYGETALGDDGKPVALRAMGRFSHEAIAIDPRNNVVYQTEDRGDAGFYRFLPDTPGNPATGVAAVYADGGRLQMLRHKYLSNLDTRGRGVRLGVRMPCTWVDIDNVEPGPGQASTRSQGRARGGAIFARLEGAWTGQDNNIYIVSTSGGTIGRGQIFQYTPVSDAEGFLTLIVDSPNANALDAPDNICVTPRGALMLAEDGGGEQFLRGVTQRGQLFNFCRNDLSEFAGCCFSPDAATLFVNIQGPGYTLAIYPADGYNYESSWGRGAF